jgi:hypothetical protein
MGKFAGIHATPFFGVPRVGTDVRSLPFALVLMCAMSRRDLFGARPEMRTARLARVLGIDHRFGPADDEGVRPFEEIGDNLCESLRPFNHQRVAGIVNEHQMRIRNQL